MLTRTIKGDGVLALMKLAAQRGELDVRLDPSDFHDRFILTDSTAYHLGPSIKDAGLKSAMHVPGSRYPPTFRYPATARGVAIA